MNNHWTDDEGPSLDMVYMANRWEQRGRITDRQLASKLRLILSTTAKDDVNLLIVGKEHNRG